MKKKLLAALLSLALMLTLLPMTALADIESPEKITTSTAVSGTCTVKSGGHLQIASGATLTVPNSCQIVLEDGGKLTISDGGTLEVKESGKIIVKSGCTLDIEEGGTLTLPTGVTYTPSETGTDRALQINEGATLSIKGTLNSGTSDFSDMALLGTMTIESTAAVKIGGGTVPYIGEGGFVTLGSNSKIMSQPNTPGNINGGYSYSLSGTAETHQVNKMPYGMTGNDEFTVLSGSTLTVPADTMTLEASARSNPLTVANGGTLDADPATVTALLGSAANGEELTSGTFTSDPTQYVASGYIVRKDGDTSYTVVAKSNLGAGTYMSDPTGFTAGGYEVDAGAVRGEYVVVAKPHVHSDLIYNPATERNIENWYCPSCGNYFLDANCMCPVSVYDVYRMYSVTVPEESVTLPQTGSEENELPAVCALLALALGLCALALRKKSER